MSKGLKRKTKSALIWNTINQFGRFGSKLLITIILARLLTPNDFGLIAMVLVITSFSDLFIESGFRIGIIQKRELTDLELSSVFYLNIFVGACCTLIVFLIAPFIAAVYDNDALVSLTQVLSLVYLFKSFSIVQQGLMSREMDFKQRTLSMLGAQLVAGASAVIAAINGFGVWSLVLNLLLQAFLMSVLLWIQTSWKPKLMFKLSSVKELWQFSSKLLLMNLLSTIGNKVDLFFVGKLFSPLTIGLYSKARDFSSIPSNLGTQVVTTSLFPVFAKLQDNNQQFKANYIRLYSLLSFVFVPVFAILFLTSAETIEMLLGHKWEGSIIYFKWSTVIGLSFILNNFTANIINAKGRSDLNLRRTLFHSPVRIGIFILLPLVFENFSPMWFIIIYIIFSFSAKIFNSYYLSKVCEIAFLTDLKLGVRYLIIGLGLVIIIEYLNLNFHSYLLGFGVKAFIFVVIYFCVLVLLKDSTTSFAVEKIKNQIFSIYDRTKNN